MLNVGLDILKLLDGLLVDVLQLAAGRHYAVPVFLGELQRTVYEVAVDANQFAVVALLEVFPCEVVVCLGRVGGEHIAQHVLLAGQLLEVFVEPYRPVARCRYLVVLEVEELVCRHVVGQDVASVSLKHCGEHDAVEHDVVLSDEVNEACLGVFPPLLPVLGHEFLGV